MLLGQRRCQSQGTGQDDFRDTVTDAANRVLDFGYNAAGRLSTIQAPFGGSGNPTHRTWTLLYEDDSPYPTGEPMVEGGGPFVALADPLDFRITMTYTEYNDIHTIANKNGHTYTLAYAETSGRLEQVTDPASHVHGFSYDALYAGDEIVFTFGTYTDIRGGTWQAKFDAATGNLLARFNPLGQATTFAYEATEPSLAHEANQPHGPARPHVRGHVRPGQRPPPDDDRRVGSPDDVCIRQSE
jgi:YD repeat-containing protein